MTVLLLFTAYALGLTVALARAGHRSQVAAGGGGTCPEPSRIPIVGATGGTGRQLVTQALARGYTVTALVRDPSKLQLDHPKLVVVQGNVLEVIVRPGVLTNRDGKGQYRHGRGIGSFVSTVRIARADVAAFMLDQLVSDADLRTATGVCR